MPLTKRVRYFAEYAAFRFVAFVFGALPVETASNVSGFLWRHLAPYNPRHKRALGHLRLAMPEKSEAAREAIVSAMWDNLGRVFAESFHIQEIADSDRIAVERLDTLTRLAEEGKPLVLCAAHTGNWELTVIGAVREGLSLAGIYQKLKNPLVDAYTYRLRAPHYPGGLFPKEPATARRMLRHARDGGTVSILADLRDSQGVSVPFFGRPAPSSSFPGSVARTLSIPLFAAHIVREPGVRFRIRVEEVPVPKTDDRAADIHAATAAMQAVFERAIRAAPEQWMWAHRRWG